MEKFGLHLLIRITNTNHNYWVENLVIPRHATIIITAPFKNGEFDAKVVIRFTKQKLINWEGKDYKRYDSIRLQQGSHLEIDGFRIVQDFEKQKEDVYQEAAKQGSFSLAEDFTSLIFHNCIFEQREPNLVVFSDKSSFCHLHMCHCKIINKNPDYTSNPVNLFEFAIGWNAGRPSAKVDLYNVHLTKGVKVAGEESQKNPNELILVQQGGLHENEDQ